MNYEKYEVVNVLNFEEMINLADGYLNQLFIGKKSLAKKHDSLFCIII
jgi:hypothetical protein